MFQDEGARAHRANTWQRVRGQRERRGVVERPRDRVIARA